MREIGYSVIHDNDYVSLFQIKFFFAWIASVASAGSLYDRALPVVTTRVNLLDDTCWVRTRFSFPVLWQKMCTDCNEATCLLKCRQESSCGASFVDKTSVCWIQSSNGSSIQNITDVLLKVTDCKEKTTELQLEVPGFLMLAGGFQPNNDYHDRISYAKSGLTVGRKFIFTHPTYVHRLPANCGDSTWVLLHTNTSDFKHGESAAPEFYGEVAACVKEDVMESTFEHGVTNFTLHLASSELIDPLDPSDVEKHPTDQEAQLRLSVASCSKPQVSTELIYGTVTTPGFYSLSDCECFGEVRHVRCFFRDDESPRP